MDNFESRYRDIINENLLYAILESCEHDNTIITNYTITNTYSLSEHSQIVYVIKTDNKRNSLSNLDIDSYFRCSDKHVLCSICLEDVKPKEFVRELKCKHNFHKKCIDSWLYECIKSNDNNIQCPICRRKITCKAEI